MGHSGFIDKFFDSYVLLWACHDYEQDESQKWLSSQELLREK